MKKSFFPRTVALLSLWLQNYKSKIGSKATALDMTGADVTEEVAICTEIIEAINDAQTQKNILKGLIKKRDTLIKKKGGKLRLNIKRHKTAVNYTDTVGKELQIIVSKTQFDADAYKPVIRIDVFGNALRIRFTKLGVNGINIYKRQKDTANFTLLTRATKNPFKYEHTMEDSTKVAHLEFRALGVINDLEIGLPSDIVEIAFSK